MKKLYVIYNPAPGGEILTIGEVKSFLGKTLTFQPYNAATLFLMGELETLDEHQTVPLRDCQLFQDKDTCVRVSEVIYRKWEEKRSRA